MINYKKPLTSFFIENKFLCIMMLLLFFLTALMMMIRPIVVGQMLHYGYSMKNISQVASGVKLLFMVNGAFVILSVIRAVIYTRFEIQVLCQLQTVVMKKLLQLPVYFFDRYTTGDLVHRVLWITSLSQLLSSSQIGAFFSFVCLLISFSLMFYFNWQLTLIVFVLIMVFTLVTVLSAWRLLPRLEGHAQDIGKAYGFFFQVLTGISRIKLFARQSSVESLWASMYVRTRNKLQDTYFHGVIAYAFFNSIPLLLLMIIFSISVVEGDGLVLQDYAVFFCGLCLLMVSIAGFYINAGGFLDALIAYRRIQPILCEPDERVDGETHETQSYLNVEHIGIHDVFFTYPDSKQAILRGLNCDILRGQHVAFVGLSGSGKSTIIKLLLGFYVPQQGQIEINGQLLQGIDLLKYRSTIGVALQDGQLMNGTILENIIGHSTATEEDALNVISDLGFDKFIEAMPMGVQTVVSQHINLLSGGQKQKLLIARALVGNPQLLILDEATNSLDNLSQEIISHRINQLGMTRITIAHRLSTVKNADKIFVLHQGAISEAGTWQQLVNQHGLFYQFAKSRGND